MTQAAEARDPQREARERREEFTLAMESPGWLRQQFGNPENDTWFEIVAKLQELYALLGETTSLQFKKNTVVNLQTREGEWSELVIRPRDEVQQEQIENLLAAFQIVPWPEENEEGETILIIEHKRDLALLRTGIVATNRVEQEAQVEAREVRYRAVLESIPVNPDELFEPVAGIPNDHLFRFNSGASRPHIKKARSAGPREERAPRKDSDITPDVLQDTLGIEEAFLQGEINEDNFEYEMDGPTQSSNETISGRLIKRKYKYVLGSEKKKVHKYIENGEEHELTELEIQRMVFRFQDAEDVEERSLIFKELALIYRTFLVFLVRRNAEKYPNADHDVLFGSALYGLWRAAELFEERDREIKFSTYMAYHVNAKVQRDAADSYMPSVYVPAHISPARKRIHDAIDLVSSAQPDRAVSSRRVTTQLGLESEAQLDKFIRKTLFEATEVGYDELEDNWNSSMVAMNGEDLVETHQAIDDVSDIELQERLTQALASLTPREERCVRLYFELGAQANYVAEDAFNELRLKLGVNLSDEQIRAKVSELNGEYGNLTLETTLEKVKANSPEDYEFITTYSQVVAKHGKDESLESVGQVYSVTRERIRQMLAKALRKMKHPSRSRKLRDFLPDED